MTTRFSKQKLAEVQEKKAKGGTVNGLLSKKKASDVVKKESTKTPPLAKRLSFPTLSLEMIASSGKEARKKNKLGAALKAHKALSMDDLGPLIAKSSNEVMSSDIQKLVQVNIVGRLLQALGESLFVSGKFLDLEKKVASSEPLIKSLSAENETFKNKVAILIAEAENDKEHVFKVSDEYSDELCKYYVEGFDLLAKWMAKHHPSLDLSGLAVKDVEIELMSDRPSKATVENVTKEATDIAEGVKEVTVVLPTDLVPEDQ
ncbi:hypothetical protein SO802_023232 [Lithocarpus litseifolius]|uniref:Uncharacterized protein n=1 Tax=Lithocarpus litseifolius TaxID=425828 RepID=A0AAW2C9M4_9ROSI